MPVTMADLKAGRVDLAEVVDPAGVPGNRLLAILVGRRVIMADAAIRIGAAIGTSAETRLKPAERLRSGGRARGTLRSSCNTAEPAA